MEATSKNLLYSTENTTQASEMTQMGMESTNKWTYIYICMADSLHCTAEITPPCKSTVQQKKKKKKSFHKTFFHKRICGSGMNLIKTM